MRVDVGFRVFLLVSVFAIVGAVVSHSIGVVKVSDSFVSEVSIRSCKGVNLRCAVAHVMDSVVEAVMEDKGKGWSCGTMRQVWVHQDSAFLISLRFVIETRAFAADTDRQWETFSVSVVGRELEEFGHIWVDVFIIVDGYRTETVRNLRTSAPSLERGDLLKDDQRQALEEARARAILGSLSGAVPGTRSGEEGSGTLGSGSEKLCGRE